MRSLSGLLLVSLLLGCGDSSSENQPHDASVSVIDLAKSPSPDFAEVPNPDLSTLLDLARQPVADLAMPAMDLAGPSCASLVDSVQKYIDSHAACTVDADCTMVTTRCGLP